MLKIKLTALALVFFYLAYGQDQLDKYDIEFSKVFKETRELISKSKLSEAQENIANLELQINHKSQHYLGRINYLKSRVSFEKSDLPLADSLIDQSIKTLSADSTHRKYLAISIIEKGAINTRLRNFKIAEEFNSLGRGMAREIYGDTSNQYMSCLNNLGILYFYQEKFEKAIAIWEEKANLAIGQNESDQLSRAKNLMNLGVAYRNAGMVGKAENYLKEAETFVEKNNYSNTVFDYQVQNNLANCLNTANKFNEAEIHFNNSAQVLNHLFGNESKSHIGLYHNIARMHIDKGDIDKALEIENEALKICKKQKTENSKTCTIVLGTMSYIHFENKEYKASLELSRKTRLVSKETIEDSTYTYAARISLEALNHIYLNQLDSSKIKHTNSINIMTSIYGEGHINTLAAKLRYLYALAINGHPITDLNQIETIFNNLKLYFIQNANFYSESEIRSLHTEFTNYLNQLTGLITVSPKEQILQNILLDWVFFQQGFILKRKIQLHRLAKQKNNDIESYDEWKRNCRLISKSLSTSKNKSNEIDSLIEVTKVLEQNVYKSYGSKNNFNDRNFNSFRSSLKPSDWICLFIEHKLSTKEKSEDRISAFIFNNEKSYFVPLTSKDTFSNNIASIKKATKNVSNYLNAIYDSENEKSKLLYNHVWSKVLKEVSNDNCTNISFVPSNSLQSLNLKCLIEAHNPQKEFQVQLISSLNLLDKNKSINKFDNAVVYANLDYGESISKSNKWNTLIWTDSEGEEISSLVNDKNINLQFFEGQNGDEQSIKKWNDSNDYKSQLVHFATHGFFNGSELSTNDIVSRGVKLDTNKNYNALNVSIHDPMLQSGIILSNVNLLASDKDKEPDPELGDGILTALEISALDLSKTNLVVLSACETGLGVVNSYEGVYGLQRGILEAGAKNIIMSLWQVSDYHTVEFMKAFYTNLLEKEQSIKFAFDNAQNEMKEKFQDPFYYAGFVLLKTDLDFSAGDGTPLYLYMVGILCFLVLVFFFIKRS